MPLGRTYGDAAVVATGEMTFVLDFEPTGQLSAWFTDVEPEPMCGPSTQDSVQIGSRAMLDGTTEMVLSWSVQSERRIRWQAER